MKKLLIVPFAATIGIFQVAIASNVLADIHIGNQPPHPAPYQAPAPAPQPRPAPVVREEPPLFLYPPELGFGIAVDVPHDTFFASGSYYQKRGNAWYRSERYNGPWVVTRTKSLPPGLRKQSIQRLHYYRDREYRNYRARHDGYHGEQYRPEKEQRQYEQERRKEDRRGWRDERRQEREERRHGGYGDRY